MPQRKKEGGDGGTGQDGKTLTAAEGPGLTGGKAGRKERAAVFSGGKTRPAALRLHKTSRGPGGQKKIVFPAIGTPGIDGNGSLSGSQLCGNGVRAAPGPDADKSGLCLLQTGEKKQGKSAEKQEQTCGLPLFVHMQPLNKRLLRHGRSEKRSVCGGVRKRSPEAPFPAWSGIQ